MERLTDSDSAGFSSDIVNAASVDEVPAIKDVCAQDLVDEAFKELRGRKELEAEYQRVNKAAQRWGC